MPQQIPGSGGGTGDGGTTGDGGGGGAKQVYIDPITGQAIPFTGKEPPLPLPPGAAWIEVKPGVWQVKVSAGGDGGSTAGGTAGGGGYTVSGGGGTSDAEVRKQRMESLFEQKYLELWGELPPPGYVSKFVNDMNVFEFAEQERHKPAWLRTEAAREGADNFVSLLRQWGAV